MNDDTDSSKKLNETGKIIFYFQGSIVCIFYCVLSNDVRMAVTKRWYQFKVRRDHARDHQRQANISECFLAFDVFCSVIL